LKHFEWFEAVQRATRTGETVRIKVDACEARTTGALPAARKNALRAVGYAVDGSARAEGLPDELRRWFRKRFYTRPTTSTPESVALARAARGAEATASSSDGAGAAATKDAGDGTVAEGELWYGDGVRAAIQIWQGAVSGKAPRERTQTAEAGAAATESSFGGHLLLYEALTGRLALRLVGDAPSRYLPKLLLDALLLRDPKALPPGFDDEKEAAVGTLLPLAWLHAQGAEGRSKLRTAVAKQARKKGGSGLTLDAECDGALQSPEGVDMAKKDALDAMKKLSSAAHALALSIAMPDEEGFVAGPLIEARAFVTLASKSRKPAGVASGLELGEVGIAMRVKGACSFVFFSLFFLLLFTPECSFFCLYILLSLPTKGGAASGRGGALAPGSKVRVKSGVTKPKYGWGSAKPGMIGVIKHIPHRADAQACVIDWPVQSGWTGLISEIELASDGGADGAGDGDARTVTVRSAAGISAPYNARDLALVEPSAQRPQLGDLVALAVACGEPSGGGSAQKPQGMPPHIWAMLKAQRGGGSGGGGGDGKPTLALGEVGLVIKVRCSFLCLLFLF
jgi:hypothetical protein